VHSSSQQPHEITDTKEDCDRTHSKLSTFHPAICRETRDSFVNILTGFEVALITYLLIYYSISRRIIKKVKQTIGAMMSQRY
jgi:hypothetical protein